MLQKNFYHYIFPDFFSDNLKVFTRLNDKINALIIPVFYNNKVDFSISYCGSARSVHGSFLDLVSDVKSRFFGHYNLPLVYKFKTDDILSLRFSGQYNVVSPVDFSLICSGLFKYILVLYI